MLHPGVIAAVMAHIRENVFYSKMPRFGLPRVPGIVLCDGSSADQWNSGHLVEVNLPSTLGDPRGITAKKSCGDVKRLHVEFRLPFGSTSLIAAQFRSPPASSGWRLP